MGERVKIIECPRDAWQGMPGAIPAEVKAEYLRALIGAGFTHIDAVSFVSPKAVPQMADSERVLELLGAHEGVEIIGIVVNRKGAERAVSTGRVNTLGFPYSISPEFLHRNQNQTQAESLSQLEDVADAARDAGMNVVAYISMAFGNPYGDAWSSALVAEACGQLAGMGIEEISLADTVGLATPEQIANVVSAAIAAQSGAEIGVHLHAERREAALRILAAYGAGCRRFDAALGGLGGCPFAQNHLVGNIPTEILIAALREADALLPGLHDVDELIEKCAAIAAAAQAG